jgi:hypothetical protein
MIEVDKNIKVDNRLCSISSIDNTRAALVSATSLLAMAHTLKRNQIPDTDLERLLLDPNGMVLANIIQTLVLHETVYADSILFDRSDDLDKAEEMFPGVVRRLFVPPSVRVEIAQTMNSISQTAPDFYTINTSEDELMSVLLDRQTSKEKPLLDKLDEEKYSLLRVPSDIIIDENLKSEADIWIDKGINLPYAVLDSLDSGARAYYYFELAQRTGLPLALGPARSKYFAGVLDDVGTALANDTPNELLEMFNEIMVSNNQRFDVWRNEGLRRTEIAIPPVAEYVVRRARNRQMGLADALEEVRMSKAAREFRDMCARVRALRKDRSTAALFAHDKMIEELKELGRKWAENCGPITEYRVRRINVAEIAGGMLEAIPLLGGVGKVVKQLLLATGLKELRLTPKILWKRPALSCELFLGDLYEAPSKLH